MTEIRTAESRKVGDMEDLEKAKHSIDLLIDLDLAKEMGREKDLIVEKGRPEREATWRRSFDSFKKMPLIAPLPANA